MWGSRARLSGAVRSRRLVDVPEGPGFGVEYNWDLIERNRAALVELK